jgi:hypothetical protein
MMNNCYKAFEQVKFNCLGREKGVDDLLLCDFLANEEVVFKVFWTGVTKTGCAGQFTDCFDKAYSIGFEGIQKILTSEFGGACVGVTLSNGNFIAQSMSCEKKNFLSCVSRTLRSNVSTKVEQRVIMFPMFCFLLIEHF